MNSAIASEGRATQAAELTVALVGNPNCGKTTLFNALTGMRQKVGNYPGVTVEKKEGRISVPGGTARVLDLPGLYSLSPHSPDEVIAREVLMGLRDDTPRPDVILNVVDASNLERNLYITSQLLDIGLPVVIALTMTDTLDKEGVQVRADVLAKNLGVPVCVVVASRKQGLNELRAALQAAVSQAAPEPAWQISPEIADEIDELKTALRREHHQTDRSAFAEAVSLLMQENELQPTDHLPVNIQSLVRDTHANMLRDGIDFASLAIDARYAWVARATRGVMQQEAKQGRRFLFNSARIDKVVMHPFWGYVLFVVVMTVVFQAIFSLGQEPATFVKDGIGRLGDLLTRHVPAGDLRDLINAGVLGGVGTTLAFLPQILLLFFFVSVLEDTGYMARAAFLMDRLMSKVGLHGKSFIPLLSSFACAIPGIMATRTIGDRKARLITILVAPLMSCSARLPVYLLMTSAFIPNRAVLKIGHITLLTLPGVTFVAMYFLGMIAAFCVAWLFHRTLLKGVSPTFLMELPPYRLPSIKTAVLQMIERAWMFIHRAGTIILAVAVVVWFLSAFPRQPDYKEHPDKQLTQSYIGHIGHAIEPVIRPLGFDWKMGVGIASSFIAREVFVTTMGTVYGVDDPEEKAGQAELGKKMAEDRDPRTGRPVFSPLVAVCLMIYYVLAMQCMSTVAVVRRETNGWKWPLFQIAYMSGLAWLTTFIVYQVGRAMGWG